MEPSIELRVAELLASRLCHDLVSPVGAVNSGIELLTEFGDDPDGESMGLISTSARTASDKLQFFRIAYGNAGSGSNVPLADGLRLIEPVCLNQRTTLAIDDASSGAMPGAGAVKLLLNLALLAGECLPKGGQLSVRVGPDMEAEITAAGEGARIADYLGRTYDEEPVAAGIAANGSVVEVFTSPEGGSWTIILTSPDGTSRVMAVGEAWLQLLKLEGERI